MIELQSDPKIVRHSEKTRQPESRVRRHSPFAGNDLTNSPLRNTDLLRKSILGNTHRLEKFLNKYFAGMWIRNFSHNGLVVIDDLYLVRTRCSPYETYSKLIVYPDAELT
jgi:hypothetical protein